MRAGQFWDLIGALAGGLQLWPWVFEAGNGIFLGSEYGGLVVKILGGRASLLFCWGLNFFIFYVGALGRGVATYKLVGAIGRFDRNQFTQTIVSWGRHGTSLFCVGQGVVGHSGFNVVLYVTMDCVFGFGGVARFFVRVIMLPTNVLGPFAMVNGPVSSMGASPSQPFAACSLAVWFGVINREPTM